MSVYMTSLNALVRPHCEAQVHEQESVREGVLCVAVARTGRMVRYALRLVGQVLVITGMALIATLSADGAHDLFIDPGAGRGEEPRPTATGRTWS